MEKTYGFDTLQLHAGWRGDPATGAHAVPLYQTSAYLFESAEDAAMQFAGERGGSIYTRIKNPTVSVLEERLCALENGYATTCFASGMAALLALTLTLAEPGDEIVALSSLYGGSYSLLFKELEHRYGVKARCVDGEDLGALEACINERTRMLYFESVANPLASIPDIRALAALAREQGLPLVCDNTFCTPWLFDAGANGVDFTLHSMTKYLCGSGTSLGGSVTDLGRFDFYGSPRFPQFNRPDEAHHGRVYAALGRDAFSARLRDYWLHDAGFSLSPFNAYMILIGMQTLSLRMERHVKNADAVARFLAGSPHVLSVSYARLPESPYHARAARHMPRGVGGVFTFRIRGGLEAGRRFINALKLFSLVANVGDARSLVVHPASTTHSPLSPEELAACGIAPDLIRLSIGTEDAADLIADLEQALAASQATA
ncbi:MAG: O-acetylhomoserine aminocarboxypropyltransferase/cysteine synthase [Clostridia bacterium]|nr:O-acetylhomoserine aminocarboxypropyltransferase/cysteine synthase [Clostridia bacterium]